MQAARRLSYTYVVYVLHFVFDIPMANLFSTNRADFRPHNGSNVFVRVNNALFLEI